MKKLEIKILERYKSYQQNTDYIFNGDLIVISGVNGTGKSQLLKIIANNTNEKISRTVKITDENENIESIENILFLSFRDNINLGNDFGQYSINLRQNNINQAWNFYSQNIGFNKDLQWLDTKKRQKYNDGTLIFNDNGTKNPSWRSIEKLLSLLKEKYRDDNIFHISRDEFEHIIPQDFIWRNENDIIQQIGNLFYMACCERADRQIECSKTTDIFDNSAWLRTAPWTVLNKLFADLGFKYRFKDDFSFHTPNMEENPKLRNNDEIRALTDLSDGEKAILKLALISLDEEISKDVKLVLFDEYDAPLNPSLTEAFYKVIEDFYINKGIQVVITTHSPATISLAPDYAEFYEIFSQQNKSPKIINVNQFDYAELKEANKSFYTKLKNQNDRIIELEKTLGQNGNALLVEDEYCQIYKIAYLKLKDITDITENNINDKFKAIAQFVIEGGYSTGGLYNFLTCPNTTLDSDCKRICLFDFDNEGYSKYKKLKTLKNNLGEKLYPEEKGSINSGLYLKNMHCNRYAMTIPVPTRLEKYVNKKSSNYCFIEIETLVSEDFLRENSKAEKGSELFDFYKMKDAHKKDFWKDLLTADKEIFKDFKPLFDSVENIFNN